MDKQNNKISARAESSVPVFADGLTDLFDILHIPLADL
jgi:hypothetical protein